MNENFPNYSDQEAYRIARLIAGYIRGTLSKKEHDELDDWVATNDENMQLFEKLTDEKNIEDAMRWMEKVEMEQALKKIKEKITTKPKLTNTSWPKLLRYGIAASVILALGAALIFKPFSGKKEMQISNNNRDLAPGGNKAILTLDGGKQIFLDTIRNGLLAEQGNISLIKKDNAVLYTSSNPRQSNYDIYNTIAVPRGGQYQLVLSDGTHVWLNAASSINYPVQFRDSERKVKITGEAYFEVTKNEAMPFKVLVGEAEIEVLSTKFNVNAYEDEPTINTTLAEGIVKINQGISSVQLNPAQSALINSVGEIKITEANLDQILAWKNGEFKFQDAEIETIMRQLARWYDVEIEYENKSSHHFNATISRDVPVSKILRLLELTKRVHFRIEEKKILVMP